MAKIEQEQMSFESLKYIPPRPAGGHYGIVYQGSKAQIADEILQLLPAGRRFMDLFGGGAAMTHAACCSGKFEKILYNEINPLLCDLIQKSIGGGYSSPPLFVTHEDFAQRKDTDGFVKYIYSFGRNGRHYLYSRAIEPWKHAAHNAIVFGDYSGFEKFGISDLRLPEGDITYRRLRFGRSVTEEHFNKYMRWRDSPTINFKQMIQFDHLTRMVKVNRFQTLRGCDIEISNNSYNSYIYCPGDVVYCDPPYEGTADYGVPFDHRRFYEWVATRDFPVYFSSYDISDNRFACIWQKPKRVTFQGGGGKVKIEKLYTNKGVF